MNHVRLLVFLLLSAQMLTACSGKVPEKPPQGFAVTIPPVAMIMRELAGETESLHLLLRAGASPHTYDPTPNDALAVGRARALVWVSDDLDGWAARMQSNAHIELFQLLPPSHTLPLPELDNHSHDDHDHHHGEQDPHFWLDPLAVKALLPALVEAMTGLNPEQAAHYEKSSEKFAQDLDRLDGELRELLAPKKGEKIILHHPSLGYFANRYGMIIAGYIESSPGKEPSPQYVARLVETIKRENVAMICTEPQLSPQAALAVAEAAGIPTVEVDPLGGRGGVDTYAELLHYNARQLLDASK